MIEKIGPRIYKGESIYKTGAAGGGGGGGLLFYTDGSITIDNKDKANPGGLSDKSYGSNFSKNVNGLFRIQNDNVSWQGGFPAPSYITGKFEIEAKLKNIRHPDKYHLGVFLGFGSNRFVEWGYNTDSRYLDFGFSLLDNSWPITYNYENPSWDRYNVIGTDNYWTNSSLMENEIVIAKCICEKKENSWNFVLFVNDEKVYDIDIGTTASFGSYVGTMFGYNGFLEFGDISINLIVE